MLANNQNAGRVYGMSNAITARLENISVSELAEMASRLMTDYRDGASVVMDAVMTALESKMPEADFIQFCSKLEAA